MTKALMRPDHTKGARATVDEPDLVYRFASTDMWIGDTLAL